MTTEKTYPKGTTKEQWERYEKELSSHEDFIKNYKYFLERITEYLDWQGQRLHKPSWTTPEIKDWVGSEISAKSSMDAPNKPGYYRAAND